MYRCNRRLSDRRRRHYRLPALLNLPTASTSSSPGPPIGVVVVAPAIPLPSPLSRASAAPVARRSSPHPTILESREAAFPSVVLMVVTDTGRVTLSMSPSRSTAASSSPRSGASAALAASFRSPILHTPRRRWEQDKRCDIACAISIGFVASHAISHFCIYCMRSHAITMRSHAIACNLMRSHTIACDLEKKTYVDNCPSS